MDKTVVKMIENLKEKTGHSLEEWKEIISAQKLGKHGEIVKFLKESHNVTHGYASEIALKVLARMPILQTIQMSFWKVNTKEKRI